MNQKKIEILHISHKLVIVRLQYDKYSASLLYFANILIA